MSMPSTRKQLTDFEKGGAFGDLRGQTHLYASDVGTIEVPLPPLPEQRRIAAILDTLDAAVRQTEQVIEKLKQVKQGLLHDLLTRGFDDNGELRPPPDEAPHLYKDSPLGRIPRRWSAITLGEVALRIGSGTTPSRSVDAFWAGGTIPWVKTGEVNFNEINDTEEHVTERAVQSLGMSLWPSGTVLVAMYGQGATRGRAAFLSSPATTNQACAAVAVNPDAATPKFLFQLLRWSYERIRGAAQGSNQSNLSGALLSAILYPIPPVEEQERSSSLLCDLDARVELEKKGHEKLRALKTGLMDDLMTGRVRVNLTGEAA